MPMTLAWNSSVQEEFMRDRTRLRLATLLMCIVSAATSSAPAQHDHRVQLKLDSSEADQVLGDFRHASRRQADRRGAVAKAVRHRFPSNARSDQD
jgi:hypothetical protein